MKNLKVFFGMFLGMLLFTTSCSDDTEVSSAELTVEEKLIQEAMSYEIAPATVEYTTLEDLNKLLVEAGLDPISEERLDKARSQFKMNVCDNIENYGDINNNGTISATDVVVAQKAFVYCDNGGGILTLPEIATCTQIIPHNARLWLAGRIEHSGPPYFNVEFTVSEKDLIVDYVLQLIC